MKSSKGTTTYPMRERDERLREKHRKEYWTHIQHFKSHGMIPTVSLEMTPQRDESLPRFDSIERELLEFGNIYSIRVLRPNEKIVVKLHDMPTSCVMYHAVNTTDERLKTLRMQASFSEVWKKKRKKKKWKDEKIKKKKKIKKTTFPAKPYSLVRISRYELFVARKFTFGTSGKNNDRRQSQAIHDPPRQIVFQSSCFDCLRQHRTGQTSRMGIDRIQ